MVKERRLALGVSGYGGYFYMIQQSISEQRQMAICDKPAGTDSTKML
jgi:hypothetical protein